MIKILSYIPDFRIKASNVLIEITIKDYLSLADKIIDANEFQRKKVISSRLKTTLKQDIKSRCTIPPIVLGVRDDKLLPDFNFEDFHDDTVMQSFFDASSLIILDGLQRTYVMLELIAEDKSGNWLDRSIRCEVLVGLEKLGLLYRMLTLNTGQTTMSTRHLLEILYFDYLDSEIDGIKLLVDKDGDSITNPLKEFKFKDIIEGYNSFIEGREVPVERADILQNIETISSLEKTNDKKEGFKVFIVTYQYFLSKINSLVDFNFSATSMQDSEFSFDSAPFGKSLPSIFGKSQAMTGFGAAIHFIKKKRDFEVSKIVEDSDKISNINNESIYYLLKLFDNIRNKSKKVGNDQRYFFKVFFLNLFDDKSETYLDFYESVKQAGIRVDEKIDML